jgi:hypothetical protein
MGKGQNSVKKSEMLPRFFERHPGDGFQVKSPVKLESTIVKMTE